MLQKEKEQGIAALKERADAVLDLEQQRDQLAKQVIQQNEKLLSPISEFFMVQVTS